MSKLGHCEGCVYFRHPDGEVNKEHGFCHRKSADRKQGYSFDKVRPEYFCGEGHWLVDDRLFCFQELIIERMI